MAGLLRPGDPVTVTSGRSAGTRGQVGFIGPTKTSRGRDMVCVVPDQATTTAENVWVEPERVAISDREARWRLFLELRARVELIESTLAELKVVAGMAAFEDDRQLALPFALPTAS
jgi:hypothetical protein